MGGPECFNAAAGTVVLRALNSTLASSLQVTIDNGDVAAFASTPLNVTAADAVGAVNIDNMAVVASAPTLELVWPPGGNSAAGQFGLLMSGATLHPWQPFNPLTITAASVQLMGPALVTAVQAPLRMHCAQLTMQAGSSVNFLGAFTINATVSAIIDGQLTQTPVQAENVVVAPDLGVSNIVGIRAGASLSVGNTGTIRADRVFL